MEIERNILPPGVRLVSARMPGTKAVTVLILFATGSRFETPSVAGISHFLEHMFFKGSRRRPTAAHVAHELDSIGASYNAFTGKEYTGYFVKAQSTHVEHALDVLTDMLFNPLFDPAEIEKEKGAVIQEFNMYYDNPREMVGDFFEQDFFGPNSLGRSILGTKEAVRSLSRADLVAYQNRYYRSPNTVVVIAGDVPESRTAQKMVSAYFRRLKKGEENRPAPITRRSKRIGLHPKATEQTHLVMGVPGLPFGAPSEAAYKLLTVALGGNMSSRLFREVRERRGLAYYVFSNTEDFRERGYLGSQAGVDNEKVELAVRVIFDQYRSIGRTLTKREIDRAREYVKGQLTLRFEDSLNVAMRYGMYELYGRPLHPLEKVLRDTDSVPFEAVKALAGRLFTPRAVTLTVLGPFENAAPFAKILKQ